MYQQFFGLRELPFNNTPDPRYFYSTPDHEEALASLIYAVNQRKGFVLLTGEVGAGKTLVSRMMLRHFGAAVAFANINHATADASDLMESVCAEFEIEHDPEASNARMVRALHDYLLSRFAQDTPVVLILDEAQSLSIDAFEQLRMIGNLEADDAKLLQIVILGQPELRDKFTSPQLRQLRQRIFRSFHLPRLNRTLTEGYIRHRLTIGGAENTDIFDSAALDRIHEHAHGIPRLINTLCDNAMLSAYSADVRLIDRPFIESVIQQMMTIEPPQAAAPVPGSAMPLGERPAVGSSHVDGVAWPRAGTEARSTEGAAGTEARSTEGAAGTEARPTVGAAGTEARSTLGTAGTSARHHAQGPAIAPRPQPAHPLRRAPDRQREEMPPLEDRPVAGGGELATMNLRLGHLERQARIVAARVEEMMGRVEGAPAQLATVRDECRGVLDEAKGVLSRVSDVVAQGLEVERRSKSAHAQLGRQAERAGRLTALLRQVLDRSEGQLKHIVDQQAEAREDRAEPVRSMPRGQVEVAAGGRTSGIDRTSDESLEYLVERSRRQLNEMRTLISATAQVADGDGAARSLSTLDDAEGDHPGGRLARKVQSLLDFIETVPAFDSTHPCVRA